MTITWTQTAGEMALEAYQRVLIVGAGATMSAYQWSRAKAHLNGMLKLLQAYGENEWRRENQTINLVEGTQSYTLTTRPDQVLNVFHVDATGRELPMSRWNYDEYETIPVKAQKGRPTSYMVERKVGETKLYVWPTADTTNAALTLRVNYARVMNDVVDQTTALDLPQEWQDPVTDMLAERLATNFRIENASVDQVRVRAETFMDAVMGHDSEESITFVMGAGQ